MRKQDLPDVHASSREEIDAFFENEREELSREYQRELLYVKHEQQVRECEQELKKLEALITVKSNSQRLQKL